MNDPIFTPGPGIDFGSFSLSNLGFHLFLKTFDPDYDTCDFQGNQSNLSLSINMNNYFSFSWMTVEKGGYASKKYDLHNIAGNLIE
jgi:hypothetical protein